jgi:hypothetical protein
MRAEATSVDGWWLDDRRCRPVHRDFSVLVISRIGAFGPYRASGNCIGVEAPRRYALYRIAGYVPHLPVDERIVERLKHVFANEMPANDANAGTDDPAYRLRGLGQSPKPLDHFRHNVSKIVGVAAVDPSFPAKSHPGIAPNRNQFEAVMVVPGADFQRYRSNPVGIGCDEGFDKATAERNSILREADRFHVCDAGDSRPGIAVAVRACAGWRQAKQRPEQCQVKVRGPTRWHRMSIEKRCRLC